MTESKHIWAPWRLYLKKFPVPYGPHIMRVENTAGSGQPDVNACFRGVEAWIELKVAKGNRLIFQPTQGPWIRQRVASGGRVFILARKEDTLHLYPWTIVDHSTWFGVLPAYVTNIPFDWNGLQGKIFAGRESAVN